MSKGHSQRAAVVVLAALCGCLAVGTPSYAGEDAQAASSPQTVASGEWGATPSMTTLSFGAQGTQQLYFSVANTGTLTLTGTTYTVSASNLKGGTTLSLSACVGGTWNVTAGTCSGRLRTIVSTTGAATSAVVSAAALFPAVVGSTVTLQAQLDKTPRTSSVGVVTVTVDRSEVRAATVTDG